MPCEGCTHATQILDEELKREPACELGDEMCTYIRGIKPCDFREDE